MRATSVSSSTAERTSDSGAAEAERLVRVVISGISARCAAQCSRSSTNFADARYSRSNSAMSTIDAVSAIGGGVPFTIAV